MVQALGALAEPVLSSYNDKHSESMGRGAGWGGGWHPANVAEFR